MSYIRFLNRESVKQNYDVMLFVITDIFKNGSYVLFNENAKDILRISFNEKLEQKTSDISDVNRFRFIIENYGSVVAGDPLTDAYLRNQLNMNSKKEDIETALNIHVENIRYGKSRDKIVLQAISGNENLPDVVHWKDKYLSDEDFILIFGQSRTGQTKFHKTFRHSSS